MRRLSKTVIMLLCFTLLFSIVACSKTSNSRGVKSSSNETSTGDSNDNLSKNSESDKREFYTITVYHALHPSSSLEDIPESGYYIDNMYEEMFNVEFDFQYVPATNEEEIFNITMASGDIPDIMTAGNWDRLHKYSEAWWPLNDFIIGKYEYLEKYFFDDPYVYALSAEQDGQIKILSMISEQFIGDVLLVRGDLVEKWGIDLSQVKTKEDWYEVLKFVKSKDDKIIPYMTRKGTNGLIQRLCEGWSGIKEYEFVDEDNTVKYGAADPRMKEVVEWLNMLYREGLIDQEYPTTNTAAWQEQVLGDGVFLTHDNASTRIRWAETEWKNLGITDRYYMAVPPIQPDENIKGYTTIHYPKLRNALAIYIGAEEGKVDRILEMINYTFSPEGFILSNYGIEGVSFRYNEEGEIEYIPEYQEAVDNKTMPPEKIIRGSFTEKIKLEPNGIYMPNNRDNEHIITAAKLYEDGGLIKRNWLEAIRFTDEELDEVTQLKADIRTYTDENLDKFIMGIRPTEEWDDFVAGFKNLNLDRYLEIYNTAFQRAMGIINNNSKD